MEVSVSDGVLWLNKTEDFTPENAERDKKGLYALEKADLFNLLCIPPYLENGDVDVSLISDAAAYCEKRRAMLLVDPPVAWKDKSTAKQQFTDESADHVGTRSKNAAFFFHASSNPTRCMITRWKSLSPAELWLVFLPVRIHSVECGRLRQVRRQTSGVSATECFSD